MQYQTIVNAISAINEIGVGALLAKTDLENAYKQVPVHPVDFELLGLSIDGQFYNDKTLPYCHKSLKESIQRLCEKRRFWKIMWGLKKSSLFLSDVYDGNIRKDFRGGKCDFFLLQMK